MTTWPIQVFRALNARSSGTSECLGGLGGSPHQSLIFLVGFGGAHVEQNITYWGREAVDVRWVNEVFAE